MRKLSGDNDTVLQKLFFTASQYWFVYMRWMCFLMPRVLCPTLPTSVAFIYSFHPQGSPFCERISDKSWRRTDYTSETDGAVPCASLALFVMR